MAPRPAPRSKRHRGQIVHSEARTMVMNVLAALEQERLENRLRYPLWRTITRAALYTGLSPSTIKRIKRECRDGAEPGSPKGRSQGGKKSFRIALAEKDMCEIRREVQEYYFKYKNTPTSSKLLELLQERIAFKWKRETMRQVLVTMGFKWRKCGNLKQKMLVEKAENVASRRNFITMIRELRGTGFEVYYMDEVWIDKAMKLQRYWETETTANRPAEDRLILIHVGNDNGFVEGTELIYQAMTTDCRNQINSTIVEKWVTEQLLPKLSLPSVIVMDNAAHHCEAKYKRPSMYVPKATMMEWLRKQNVEFDEQASRGDLYSLIESLRPREKIYKIDSLLAQNGHTVLRMPPHTCDLNAIELAWTKMESIIDENEIEGEFALEKLEALLRYSMESVTPDDWKQYVETTINIEDEYCTKDEQIEEILDDLMVQASSEGDQDAWTGNSWSSSSDSDGELNW